VGISPKNVKLAFGLKQQNVIKLLEAKSGGSGKNLAI
jgi:hypothetical protein